ncbi:MAG: flagellar basal-body MS-ring/collar protein FliF [Pseudomonadota bacterium]
MAQAPGQGIAALLQGFLQLNNSQKIGFIFGLAALIAVVSGLWMWSQAPTYRVLFANVSDRDGGAIIASLQQMNIPYQMAEGGGAILVPSTQVYEARLKLASQGLPRGGAIGFELMENQKLGISQFAEQVNYQRALEGELSRTIQSLAAVQGARVHLAIPRPTVFIRDAQKPSASVLVSVYPGRVLDQAQVNGITHLVSSSVPDLPVKNVTVVDQAGNLLSNADDSMAANGLDPGQLSYLRQVEESYAKRIEDILLPIAGPDNVRAQVAASLDFTLVEQTSETFKPNASAAESAIRSQQSSETVGTSTGPGGIPGALSNQPPGTASAPLTAGAAPAAQARTATVPENQHKESTINYEVDKTIRHVKNPAGSVKKLSVAVVVNYRKTTDAKGKVSTKPLTDQEMGQITNLVKEAVGFNAERGDTVNVVNASFNAGEREDIPPTPFWKDPGNIATAKEVGRNALIAGIFLYLVLGVLRPMLRELARAGQKAAEVRAQVAAQPTSVGTRHPNYEADLQAAKDMARQDPRLVANVVKDWVGNE